MPLHLLQRYLVNQLNTEEKAVVEGWINASVGTVNTLRA
jgi:hypothetical protein